MEPLTASRDAIVARWLAATLETYPPGTRRLLATGSDPFRNPAGHLLRQNLEVLVESVVLSEDWPRAARALDAIMQLRAVQGFTAEEAVGFVGALREIAETTTTAADRAAIDDRIARLAGLARERLLGWRARLDDIRASEVRRRTGAFERRRAAANAGAPAGVRPRADC